MHLLVTMQTNQNMVNSIKKSQNFILLYLVYSAKYNKTDLVQQKYNYGK